MKSIHTYKQRASGTTASFFHGDCRQVMRSLSTTDQRPQTIFADQPYNIGVEYDNWDDRLSRKKFESFTKEWLQVTYNWLKPGGALFLYLPPSIANWVWHYCNHDLKMISVNDIVIVQRFGQCTRGKFISGHVRLLYLVKPPIKQRVWEPNNVLVESLRASKYGDKRTADSQTPGQRVPLDVWGMDEPHFGRVQGNNAERRELHPNQVPEAVVRRCILSTTKPGDLVADPFNGSGTTTCVALAHGRHSIGIDNSKAYCKSAYERTKIGMAR